MAGGEGIEPPTLAGDCFQDSVLSQFAYHPRDFSLHRQNLPTQYAALYSLICPFVNRVEPVIQGECKVGNAKLNRKTLPTLPFILDVQTFFELFCELGDKRKPKGQRYPLPVLALVALLAKVAGENL